MKWKAIHDCSVSHIGFGKTARLASVIALGWATMISPSVGRSRASERLAKAPVPARARRSPRCSSGYLVLVTSRESSPRPVHLGQGRFKRQNGLGACLAIIHARQFEKCARYSPCRASRYSGEAAGCRAQVVVAAGKAKAGLARAHDIAGWDLPRSALMKTPFKAPENRAGPSGRWRPSKLDTAAIWSQPRTRRLQHPARLDGLGVHPAGEQIADHLLIGNRARRRRARTHPE